MPPPLTCSGFVDSNLEVINILSHPTTHLGPLAAAKVDEVEPGSAALAV